MATLEEKIYKAMNRSQTQWSASSPQPAATPLSEPLPPPQARPELLSSMALPPPAAASAPATGPTATATAPPPPPPHTEERGRSRSRTGDGAYNIVAHASGGRPANRSRSSSNSRAGRGSVGGSGALRDRSNSRSRPADDTNGTGGQDVNSRLYAAALERKKKQEMRQSTYLEKEVRRAVWPRGASCEARPSRVPVLTPLHPCSARSSQTRPAQTRLWAAEGVSFHERTRAAARIQTRACITRRANLPKNKRRVRARRPHARERSGPVSRAEAR